MGFVPSHSVSANWLRPLFVLLAAAVLFAVQPIIIANLVYAQDGKKPCECRANGQTWQLGERTCVMGNMRICGMNANVTTWIETAQPCNIS
jgi:hypothetical protein